MPLQRIQASCATASSKPTAHQKNPVALGHGRLEALRRVPRQNPDSARRVCCKTSSVHRRRLSPLPVPSGVARPPVRRVKKCLSPTFQCPLSLNKFFSIPLSRNFPWSAHFFRVGRAIRDKPAFGEHRNRATRLRAVLTMVYSWCFSCYADTRKSRSFASLRMTARGGASMLFTYWRNALGPFSHWCILTPVANVLIIQGYRQPI